MANSDWPKQKAFCDDFERLKDAVGDLATTLRTIPEIEGGDPGIPPVVDIAPAETLDLHEDPYVVWDLGFAYPGTIEGQDVYIIYTPDLYSPEERGLSPIGNVFLLPLENLMDVYEEDINELDQTMLVIEWRRLYAEMIRLREAANILNGWAYGVTEGADNEEAREAIEEALRRLATMETAIDETMKKWRKH